MVNNANTLCSARTKSKYFQTARIDQHSYHEHWPPLNAVILSESEQISAAAVAAIELLLNRRGEPIICSPDDALNMIATGKDCRVASNSAYGSDLQNFGIEGFLVRESG